MIRAVHAIIRAVHAIVRVVRSMTIHTTIYNGKPSADILFCCVCVLCSFGEENFASEAYAKNYFEEL